MRYRGYLIEDDPESGEVIIRTLDSGYICAEPDVEAAERTIDEWVEEAR